MENRHDARSLPAVAECVFPDNQKGLSSDNDHILLWAKDADSWAWNLLPRTEKQDNTYTASVADDVRPIRQTVSDLVNIKKYLFGGFRKCLYEIQKFDVDSERRFAVILEDDNAVLKWFKPARGQFQIYYHKDQAYEPDFLWNCGPLVKRMRIVLVKQIQWRTALVDWRQRRRWPRARLAPWSRSMHLSRNAGCRCLLHGASSPAKDFSEHDCFEFYFRDKTAG